ncbi:hypothetical protein Tdes44962_MAKER04773 [Teratosphaeria destructans]|uniref:Uncharacterized protein n=1 Tax=Teratosphaeria destructans TaxID=418781 RepID=A0A9W7VZN0_9PEZI|nr:hypothetical protein Tdes44962_MAKER04773 [Teratosphaeria destructans]
MPPKARGANRRACSNWFKHTDQGTQPTAEVPEAVTSHQFACYSVYHDHGIFYTVHYDATSNKVGDGIDATATRGNTRDSSDDSSGSTVDEEEDHDDWSTISFNWADQRRKLSYAGQRQPFQRLPLRRHDQIWADQLLPDRYQASQDRYTQEVGSGGMVGDLPLLIGLVAFAMPATFVPGYLGINLGNTFSAPQNFPRGCGWQDWRGVVVTVYYDPQRTSREELERYQRGELGAIFP